MELVFWRMMITSVSILFLVNVWKHIRSTPRRLLLPWMGIGMIVALHWVAFFASIKAANASIGVICIATTSFFTAILEPLILGGGFRRYEILLSIPVVLGMWLVVDGIEAYMHMGIYLGLISAVLLALFGVLNKKLVNRGNTLFITWVELTTGGLLVGILLLVMPGVTGDLWPTRADWLYLLVLAIGCTTLGYVLSLNALKHLSAYTSMMALNLEPIYGIVLAHLILRDGEDLTVRFYLGVLIILATIFIHPILSRRTQKVKIHG